VCVYVVLVFLVNPIIESDCTGFIHLHNYACLSIVLFGCRENSTKEISTKIGLVIYFFLFFFFFFFLNN
jgi:hypothetical protein